MITAQPVTIATGDEFVDGRLIYVGDALIGVLQHLEGSHYEQEGQWNLEAGFGPLEDCEEVFPTVDAAIDWIRKLISSPT